MSPQAHLPVGEDVTVYVLDLHQPSSSTPFYSDLVLIFVFMALSTVFHSINPPDQSLLLSPAVLPVFILPYRSFQIYTSLRKFAWLWYDPQWLTRFKTPTNYLSMCRLPMLQYSLSGSACEKPESGIPGKNIRNTNSWGKKSLFI